MVGPTSGVPPTPSSSSMASWGVLERRSVWGSLVSRVGVVSMREGVVFIVVGVDEGA